MVYSASAECFDCGRVGVLCATYQGEIAGPDGQLVAHPSLDPIDTTQAVLVAGELGAPFCIKCTTRVAS